jgi:hypothetical protein
VPITTKVVSLNPVYGKLYSIQHYVICQWLETGLWFSPGTPISSTNKTDHHTKTIYRTELQISCVFAFFTLWKRVKTHVLSDQSVHITHTYYCVSKLSKLGTYLYSRVHFMLLLIFNEQRVPKITFVLVLTYYVKLHLFVILTAIGWFIVNIQSHLFWQRCLEGKLYT